MGEVDLYDQSPPGFSFAQISPSRQKPTIKKRNWKELQNNSDPKTILKECDSRDKVGREWRKGRVHKGQEIKNIKRKKQWENIKQIIVVVVVFVEVLKNRVW